MSRVCDSHARLDNLNHWDTQADGIYSKKSVYINLVKLKLSITALTWECIIIKKSTTCITNYFLFTYLKKLNIKLKDISLLQHTTTQNSGYVWPLPYKGKEEDRDVLYDPTDLHVSTATKMLQHGDVTTNKSTLHDIIIYIDWTNIKECSCYCDFHQNWTGLTLVFVN